MNWIYAKLNLAMALLIHLFWKRWFQKRGLKEFFESYREDRAWALSSEERNSLPTHSNCIYCGLCVSQCETTHSQFFQVYQTPAAFPFSSTRSLSEISVNQNFVEACPSCKLCEKVCPTGVPLTEISGYVKKHVYS